jgi:DNA-binding Lrp family transcriptional regulator
VDAVDRKILDRLQAGLPLEERPFAALGREVGLSEVEVLERIRALCAEGLIRRIGPVIDPERSGRAGILGAMAVPPERFEAVAATVSAIETVTHNYERVARHGECPYNLWFTLTADSEAARDEMLDLIARATGLPVARFPVVRKFKIGVRFALAEEQEEDDHR